MGALDLLLGSLLDVGLGRRGFRLGRISRAGAMASIAALAYRAWTESQGGRGGGTRRRVVKNETIVRPSAVAPEERLPDAGARTPPPLPGRDGERPAELEPPPQGSEFLPTGEEEHTALELLCVRAMIAAAHADGRLDSDESARIQERIESAPIHPEHKAVLAEELRRPTSVESLVAAAGSPAVGAQVYTASLLAIELDRTAERTHLTRLANGLRLDPRLVERLHANAARFA